MARPHRKHIALLTAAAIVACGLILAGTWGAARAVTMTGEPERPVNTKPLRHIYPQQEYAAMVDSAANFITDSAGSLAPLMEKLLALRSGADSVVSILHIGDSHIQAGYWTARLRELFHEDFGNAGRGLIVPYKLAGGNEPPNYAIRTPHAVTTDKATSNSSGTPLGLTGVGVAFNAAEAQFEIWSKNSFNAITVLHHEKAPMIVPHDSLSIGSYCTIDNGPGHTRLVLNRTLDTVTLGGTITADLDNPTFYGFSLENDNPGVLYHAIGSNGAAFQHFTSNTTFTRGGADALHPDLIIISLGTNNCYGRNYNSDQLYKVIERFVESVCASYPDAAILLTTPRESGKRSGRRYVPNANIADAARLIRSVAHQYGVACWDLYSAAGGKDICEKWLKAKLSHTDRIHLTREGYALTGDMLYEAFARYYNGWLDDEYGRAEENNNNTATE